MSAAVDLSMGVLPVVVARDIWQVPCGTNAADDRCALWEAALEPAVAPSASDWREIAAIQQAIPLPLMPDSWAGSSERADAEPAPVPTPPPRAMPSAASESVSIFVHAATVAIVVRNVALSEEKALQSAFATAGELAGERGALHQLTLNGRTIYQQRGDPDPRDDTHAGWRLTA